MQTRTIQILALTIVFSNACSGNSGPVTSDAGIATDASVITADPSTYKLVFRTQSTSGDFARQTEQTAAARADSICQSVAVGAQFEGTYRAWLSDDLSSPNDRFQHSSTPYVLVQSTAGETIAVVAANWDELISGQLRTEINRDSFGFSSIFDGPMWTGTLANGKSDGQNHCNNWTSKEGQNASGSDATTNSEWTAGPARDCMERGGLYCFQQ